MATLTYRHRAAHSLSVDRSCVSAMPQAIGGANATVSRIFWPKSKFSDEGALPPLGLLPNINFRRRSTQHARCQSAKTAR